MLCANCSGKTRHKVLQSVDIKGEGYYLNEVLSREIKLYDSEIKYQIVQCQGCDSISFRKWNFLPGNEVSPIDGSTLCIESVELYPPRFIGRNRIKQDEFLPENVAKIYNETYTAICNNQPILASIGIRALVEAVCKDKEAFGNNLEAKIDSLVTMGILTQSKSETLHSMRILGNVSVHEVKPPSEEILNTVMDIVEHLLNDVYIIPVVSGRLPRRR